MTHAHRHADCRHPAPPLPCALQLWVHCVLMAFVMVVLSALILTPRKLSHARQPCL